MFFSLLSLYHDQHCNFIFCAVLGFHVALERTVNQLCEEDVVSTYTRRWCCGFWSVCWLAGAWLGFVKRWDENLELLFYVVALSEGNRWKWVYQNQRKLNHHTAKMCGSISTKRHKQLLGREWILSYSRGVQCGNSWRDGEKLRWNGNYNDSLYILY